MKIIDGGLSVDDRGTVTYVNDFDFKDVKRFYMVENHAKGFVRAWHGHKKEGKYVYVVSGAAIVAYFPMDKMPYEEHEEMSRYVLSSSKPQILYIPSGNYNGFKTLTDDTRIIFFSTSTLEESKDDDLRRPAHEWKDIWKVEAR